MHSRCATSFSNLQRFCPCSDAPTAAVPSQVLDLLYTYSNNLVGQDMVPGNFPLEWIAPSCRVRTMMASLSLPLLHYHSVLEVYNNIINITSLYIPSIPFAISSCRAKFFSAFDKQDRISWRNGIRMCTIVVKAFPLQNFEDAKLETFRVTCYAGFYRVINHTCCADGSVV